MCDAPRFKGQDSHDDRLAIAVLKGNTPLLPAPVMANVIWGWMHLCRHFVGALPAIVPRPLGHLCMNLGGVTRTMPALCEK